MIGMATGSGTRLFSDRVGLSPVLHPASYLPELHGGLGGVENTRSR